MTDFTSWTRENLIRVAHDLREENQWLHEDIQALRKAWRDLVSGRCQDAALPGTPDPQSHRQSPTPATGKPDAYPR